MEPKTESQEVAVPPEVVDEKPKREKPLKTCARNFVLCPEEQEMLYGMQCGVIYTTAEKGAGMDENEFSKQIARMGAHNVEMWEIRDVHMQMASVPFLTMVDLLRCTGLPIRVKVRDTRAELMKGIKGMVDGFWVEVSEDVLPKSVDTPWHCVSLEKLYSVVEVADGMGQTMFSLYRKGMHVHVAGLLESYLRSRVSYFWDGGR